jgi:hypothetical protein
MAKCPECGQNTLRQSMRADFCTSCEYYERYEDAYASEDPGGDFEDAEKFRPNDR